MKNKFREFYRNKINKDIENELKKIDKTGVNKEYNYSIGTYTKWVKVCLITLLIIYAILLCLYIAIPEWGKVRDVWFGQI